MLVATEISEISQCLEKANKNLLRHDAKWAFKHGEYTWNWESQAALNIFAIQNAHQLWSLKKASRSFQQGRGPSRGFIRVLWNVASVDCSITDYGGDDEDGDKYSGPVSGGGRRGHQLLQSRGQWQHSAAQGADTDVVLSTPAAQSGRGTQDMGGSWQSITKGNVTGTLSSTKHHIWSAHFQLVAVLIPTPPPPLHSPRVHYNPGPVGVTSIASYWVSISTLRLRWS